MKPSGERERISTIPSHLPAKNSVDSRGENVKLLRKKNILIDQLLNDLTSFSIRGFFDTWSIIESSRSIIGAQKKQESADVEKCSLSATSQRLSISLSFKKHRKIYWQNSSGSLSKGALWISQETCVSSLQNSNSTFFPIGKALFGVSNDQILRDISLGVSEILIFQSFLPVISFKRHTFFHFLFIAQKKQWVLGLPKPMNSPLTHKSRPRPCLKITTTT